MGSSTVAMRSSTVAMRSSTVLDYFVVCGDEDRRRYRRASALRHDGLRSRAAGSPSLSPSFAPTSPSTIFVVAVAAEPGGISARDVAARAK
jgi:hypothetical protein